MVDETNYHGKILHNGSSIDISLSTDDKGYIEDSSLSDKGKGIVELAVLHIEAAHNTISSNDHIFELAKGNSEDDLSLEFLEEHMLVGIANELNMRLPLPDCECLACEICEQRLTLDDEEDDWVYSLQITKEFFHEVLHLKAINIHVYEDDYLVDYIFDDKNIFFNNDALMVNLKEGNLSAPSVID